MILRLQALTDLLRHYAAVFSAAWGRRRDLEPVQRLDHELAFLPASLELVDRPVHPAPRWAMQLLSVFAVLVGLLTVVGQLDIVVSAKGKLVPIERVKLVQPAVTGVVRRILVRDGQRVAVGDLLMELDPTQANADESKVHSSKVAAALAQARATALLAAQQQARPPVIGAVDAATPEELKDAQRLSDGVISEYQDKVASAQATARRREAELESTHHQIAKLRATAPLARQQANDYQSLVERKYVTRTDALDKEANALQQEHELEAQISHARELDAGIVGQRAEQAAIASQFRREQLDALDKAHQQLVQGKEDETKAQTRRALMSLKSPASGMVQQLAVHTVGGVVGAAQTVMEIVPDDVIEIEVTIENKDVGFVRPGQEVTVKVDAFPYTRYGTLRGVVKYLSSDAVQDKRSGLNFVAHIQLPTSAMQINGQAVKLSPGMAVSAEVKTGKRSVAGYFLDPFVQIAQESLRER